MIYAAAVVLILPVIGLAVLSLTSRRPQGLGVTEGRLAACLRSPNCVSSDATDPRQRMAPIPFEDDPEVAMRRLEAALEVVRARIVSRKDGYIRAEAVSFLFRFVDDLEFLLDRQARVFRFRSASRVGYSDLGANRTRLERIRQAFERSGPQ